MFVRALRSYGVLPIMIVALAACALQDGTRGAPITGGRAISEGSQTAADSPDQIGPQLIVGRDGTLHLFWTAVSWGSSWEILYSRSEDQGTTWLQSPVSLKPDTETVAAGVAAATDSKGRLYVIWRQGDQATKSHRLMLTRSADGGKSWSVPAKEIASSPTIGFPYLLVDDDGGIHVAWLEGPVRGRRHLAFTTSRDFGETFAREPIRLEATDPASQSGLINVRIASDGTGRIYVVWEEDVKRRGASTIYLNRSVDHGRTWAEKPILVSPPEETRFGLHSPQIIVAPDGRVAVMWEQFDERTVTPKDGQPQNRIDRVLVVNRSFDGGQSWPVKPIRLNTINPSAWEAVESLHGRLSADQQGNLYAVWVEADGQTPQRLLLSRSTDFGSTWDSPPVQLQRTSPLGAPPFAPVIRHDERGYVWVLWQEHAPQPDGWQILINGSEDRGETWRRRAVRLTDPTDRFGTIRSSVFRVEGDGTLFVAWDEGRRAYQRIAFTRSADTGRTWLPQPVRIGRP